MMSISDSIRALARDGLSTADIARKLGIRYQHAYNVLKRNGEGKSDSMKGAPAAEIARKKQLTVEELTTRGFVLAARWVLSEQGDLVLDRPISKDVGVYALAKGNIILYVGVATMGLAKRLYFYGKPGASQRTSQRLNKTIKEELRTAASIDVYTASPPDFEWNGLPVHGSAGLELGLIKRYELPWNMRSSG